MYESYDAGLRLPMFTNLDAEECLRFVHRAQWTPEKRLMLAVLSDAVWTVYYGPPKGNGPANARQSLADAREWFASDESDWIFSFVFICETLNIDPSWLRKGLKEFAHRAKLERKSRQRPNVQAQPMARQVMSEDAETGIDRRKAG